MIAVVQDYKQRFCFEDEFFDICELLDQAFVRGSQNASGASVKLDICHRLLMQNLA